MASLKIETLRSLYSGKSDAEAAKAYAQENGYIAIVFYKNSPSVSNFTNIGACLSEEQIRGYFDSPYCYETKIIYPMEDT
jgi:hypothetical protein